MIRKRTIAARVERLWEQTRFPRTYPTTGLAYCFMHRPPSYVLNRGQEERDDQNTCPVLARTYHTYGYAWADAHEYAHGIDWSGDKRPAYRPESNASAFHVVCQVDSLRATRDSTSPTRERGYIELFADTIAFTLVNDRLFMLEHPAKYQYARTLLQTRGVI